MGIKKKTILIFLILLGYPCLLFSQDIHEAAWNGDMKTVKSLVENDPILLNEKGPWGWTPLQRAVFFKHLDVVEYLTSRGADPNLLTPEGETALHWAVKQGHVDLSLFLLSKGGDANIQDKWGFTPFHLAVQNGYTRLVQMLLDQGMNPALVKNPRDKTLLHLASINGHLDIAQLLLKYGMNVNAMDRSGNNALYYALKYGHRKIADLLKTSGAERDERDELADCSDWFNQKLKRNEAMVWYLGNCGWAVRTKNHVLIFDYWGYGENPDEPSLANGHIIPEEIQDMNVTVFVTHSHVDHFDSVIFEWEEIVDSIHYVFGWEAKDNPDYIYMTETRSYEYMNGMEIYTINSHHVDVPEVAYLIKVDGFTLYFNGDYYGEIRKDIDYLSGKSQCFDLAFSEGGASVTPYMLEKMKPAVWFPMHERGTEFKYKKYIRWAEEAGLRTQVVCAENRGDRYLFKADRIREIF